MKNYLFPNKYKKAGLLLFIVGFTLFIMGLFFNVDVELSFLDIRMPVIMTNPLFSERQYFQMVETNISIHLIILSIIIGGLMFGFSKERIEDELISDIRKSSLIWAIYFNYSILILSLFFLADFDMLMMTVFNVFTLLLFFIIRFEWKKHQLKTASHEE
ncbi:hypothetical protein F0365_10555 [Nonlabens sp. Ci31]|jgi:hypothetical protein|uniref:hypothetical protein n=1 Tax=Nonlabens sp. Ci31 TaxID=2608253 RepID=UPI0014633BA1|nr:hypothetical protein [Nonlabens sp. Ci31]QJP34798.1 hypothetical protein F0365_10555 [Nonlabens sp. Ci31]